MPAATAPDFRIRPAQAAEAAAIARLAGELGYPNQHEAMRSRLNGLLGNARQRILVLEQTPALWGWIAAERRDHLHAEPCVEITALVIDRTQRRRGLGQALLGAVEHWARQLEIAELAVHSNVSRDASHALYARTGFIRVKTGHAYIKTLRPL